MKVRMLLGGAVVAAATIGLPTAALAQTEYTTPPDEVEGIEFSRAPEPVKVLGVQETNDPGALPVTGADLAGLAFLGAGAVALGTVLVRRGRTASVTA